MILPISGAYFGKFGPLKWLLGAYFITQDPQKGTNGDPAHGPTTYGANWGGILSKIGGLEGQNGFKTGIFSAQNCHF